MTAERSTDPPCRLSLREGRVCVQLPGDDTWVPAKVVYLRPLSAREELTFLNDDGEELLTLGSLEDLDERDRDLAATELARRYHMPVIERVDQINTLYGTHYWHVQTDKGSTSFALKEPGKNVAQVPPARLILRDTMGNRFLIEALADLDRNSQREVNRIL